MNYLNFFEVNDNSLYLDNKSLPDLAKKYGTPIIVYSKRKIVENVQKILTAFGADIISIHFSVKSNYNPAILRILKELGIGIDAANLNEVELAIKVGISPGKIIATPNNLSRKELEAISEKGVKINFDDINQMKLIKDHLPRVVSFRINPGIGKGEFEGIVTGGKGSKFGMPADAAVEAYRAAKDNECKEFGIHMMTGSNVLDPSFFKESSKLFFSIAERISKEVGIEFEFLDLGGSLGVPYRQNEEELDIKAVAKNILTNFQESQSRGFFKQSRLIVEPGRFIIANAAVLLSTVTNIKEYDEIIVGTDASMNSLLRIPLYGAVHPLIVANKATEDLVVTGKVTGQVCENTDVMFKSIQLPRVSVGDTIAILNAGAYVTSMSSNYNLLKRPTELLLDGQKETIIKREETLDDMLVTFVIPP